MNNSVCKMLIATAFLTFGSATLAAPVDIQINDVTDGHGPIYVNVFNDARAWDNEHPSSVITIPATRGSSRKTVDMPDGDYAFFLFQDLNGNGVLDRSGIGFPAEPYAFSNNVQIQFSKPSFDDLKFNVTNKGAEQRLNLNHP